MQENEVYLRRKSPKKNRGAYSEGMSDVDAKLDGNASSHHQVHNRYSIKLDVPYHHEALQTAQNNQQVEKISSVNQKSRLHDVWL